MIAVFRRELRSFFHSMRAGLFFGGMLALTGLFTTLYCLYYGYSEFEYAVSFLTVGLGLLLPLVTVPMFGAERGEGGERLLRTLPIRPRDVIFGKYLAGVTVLGLLSLILMLFPIFLGFFAEVYYLTAYAAILALFLMGCALLALGLFLSYIIRVKWFARYMSIFVPFLLALLAVLARYLSEPFYTVLNALSVFGSFSPFVFGLGDLRALILYVTLAALFLGLTVIFAERRASGNGQGSGKRMIACLVAMALLVNVGAFLIPSAHGQLDLTKSKKFTLQPETKMFLKGLEEDVTLYVLEGEDKNTELEYFMKEMAAQSPHLRVRFVDPADCEELLAKVGISWDELSETERVALDNAVIADSARRTTMLDYYSMLQYKVTDSSILSFLGQLTGSTVTSPLSWYDYQQYLYYLEMYAQQDSQYQQYLYGLIDSAALHFNGETLLSGAIEYVSARIIPAQYVLTGHGEAVLEETGLGYIVNEVGYTYHELDLAELEQIPEDAASVLVLAPETDYSDAELSMMRDYLTGGGRMTVVTGEEQLAHTGLMGLMEEFGMTAQPGAVGVMVEQVIEEESEDTEQTEQTEESEEDKKEPETEIVPSYTVDTAANGDHDILAYFAGVSGWVPTITNGNAIVFDEGAETELTELLITSKDAFIGEETEQTESRVLAAVAEHESGGGLVWFTGAKSFLNSRVDMITYGNSLCLMLAMDWTDLVYESEVTAVEAVYFGSTYVSVSDGTRIVFALVSVLLIPLAVIGASWGTVYKRKKA